MRAWLLGTALVAAAAPSAVGDTRPLTVETDAPARLKPARTELSTWHRRDVVRVKFKDGLIVRLRGGALSDLGSGALDDAAATLAQLSGGAWRRAHSVDESALDALRARARSRLARHVADLNLQFDFVLPRGVSPERAIDALNALECVELADPSPLPPPAPTPPDFQPNQGYLDVATKGIVASGVWTLPGGTGANVRVADVEYSWNANHADLPPVTLIGPAVVDPFSNPQHGTATMGQIVARQNGFGVTGIAHGAQMFFAAANTSSGYHPDAAITAIVAAGFGAGDVLMLEQQAFGPGGVTVAAEWDVTVYNAIVTAVGNGVTVVEAAGNSGQDFDAPIYSQGNGGHWPFLPQNDSGAILVGAGGSPTGLYGDRARAVFSCYGSTVDLQGWGESVYTTGFGSAYSAEGIDQYYASAFNGTSSATPIVAGACVLVQSIHRARTGSFLTSAQIRTVLRDTGSPQLPGSYQGGSYPVSQSIGPRPDVAAALQALGDGASTTFCAGDGRGTTCPCGNDSPVASARGCKNSNDAGASLTSIGDASLTADSLTLLGSSLPDAPLLFLQGDAQLASGSGTLFGDGLRCAGGNLVRLGTRTASGGASAFPSNGSMTISQRAQVASPGFRYYEICYRNAAAFCTSGTFNASNGVSVLWGP